MLIRFPLSLLLSALLVSGTVQAKTERDVGHADPKALYEDALSRATDGDFSGAVIQLKNLLQQAPRDLPARIALGRYQLRTGQPEAAEKELRRALELGADKAQVLPVLGNALLMQRKYENLLDTLREAGPGADQRYEILLLRARAQLELGRLREAGAAFDAARLAAPKRTEPLVGLALVALADGRADDAMRHVDSALSLDAKDTEAWYQKGEIARARREPAQALDAWGQTLVLNPNHMRARIARAGVLSAQGQFEPALADAEYVLGRNPNDIQAAFLAGQCHVALGDEAKAKEYFETAGGKLNAIKEDALMKEPSLLRMASFLHYSRGDMVRAERYLARYAQLNPRDLGMQVLLGRVQLMQGDAKSAIGTLFPLYKRDPANLDILLPLGQAYFKDGHYTEAAAMFEDAQRLVPGDNRLPAQLALSRIGIGQWDEAMADLAEADAQSGGKSSASVLLVLLNLKLGKPDVALPHALTLEEKAPTASAANLVGLTQAARGDVAAARAAFERALERDAGFDAANHNLARFDLAAGDTDAAARRFETILARNARSVQAMQGLADVALARRDPRGAVDWLGKAVAIAPRDTATRVRLVELQLGLGDKPAALKTAEALASSLPENPDALELLGRAQAATGDRERAQRSFREAVRYAGFNLPALMRIARHQVGQLDFDAARKTLIKAAQANGDTSAAQAALVRLDLRTRRFDAARERAAQLVEDPRTAVMGRVLLGETALAERDPTAAITHFEEALNEQANPVAMLGLFDALNAAGKPADALIRLEAWTVAHPDDREARRKLALWYVPNGRLADAQKMLEALIVDEPRDPVLLSTLARIYQLDKDGRALDLASRAVEAQPDWAPGLETLGWILVTQGDIPKGLDYLRQSIAREENPLTRMHIAQALKESGRIAEARAELQVLLATHPTLPWKADVDALNASLGSTPQTP